MNTNNDRCSLISNRIPAYIECVVVMSIREAYFEHLYTTPSIQSPLVRFLLYAFEPIFGSAISNNRLENWKNKIQKISIRMEYNGIHCVYLVCVRLQFAEPCLLYFNLNVNLFALTSLDQWRVFVWVCLLVHTEKLCIVFIYVYKTHTVMDFLSLSLLNICDSEKFMSIHFYIGTIGMSSIFIK